MRTLFAMANWAKYLQYLINSGCAALDVGHTQATAHHIVRSLVRGSHKRSWPEHLIDFGDCND